jgi:hypothetical protein
MIDLFAQKAVVLQKTTDVKEREHYQVGCECGCEMSDEELLDALVRRRSYGQLEWQR